MDSSTPHSQPAAPWLEHLTRRFTEIAARRVPDSAVDDVVQDALTVVVERGPAAPRLEGETRPSLRWCFGVLRNVIGNYYQKRRADEPLEGVTLVDRRPGPLAAMAVQERQAQVRAAMDELEQGRPDCARWLWAVAQGRKAGELARQAGIEAAAFYRRLHRCRLTLAEILRKKGVNPR